MNPYDAPFIGMSLDQQRQFRSNLGAPSEAMTGYLIAGKTPVPAGTRRLSLTNIPRQGTMRAKISFHTAAPSGVVVPVRTGISLTYEIQSSTSGDEFQRFVTVSVGDGQTLFVPARGLTLFVSNSTPYDLDANFTVDEHGGGGIGFWSVTQILQDIVAETALNIPPFTQSFEVFGLPFVPPTLTGYGPTLVPTVMYQEPLAAPRSGPIPRVQNIDYTLTPFGPPGGVPRTYVVRYQCQG